VEDFLVKLTDDRRNGEFGHIESCKETEPGETLPDFGPSSQDGGSCITLADLARLAVDGVSSELTGEFNLAELKDFERAEPILPKGVAKTEANEVTLGIFFFFGSGFSSISSEQTEMLSGSGTPFPAFLRLRLRNVKFLSVLVGGCIKLSLSSSNNRLSSRPFSSIFIKKNIYLL